MLDVMIIDDEEEIVNGLSHIIDWKKLGFNVVCTATDALDALEKIKILRPDLVVTDIRMPGMSGLDLIAEVRKMMEDIQLIIISGYSDFAYAKEAIGLGVARYLLKPVDEDELIEALLDIRKRTIHMEYTEHADDLINQMLLHDLVKGISLSHERLDKIAALDQYAPFRLMMVSGSINESGKQPTHINLTDIMHKMKDLIDQAHFFVGDDCLYVLLMKSDVTKQDIKLNLFHNEIITGQQDSISVIVSSAFSRILSVMDWAKVLRSRLRHHIFFQETNTVIECCNLKWLRSDKMVQCQITNQMIHHIKKALSFFHFEKIERAFDDLRNSVKLHEFSLTPDDVQTICIDVMSILQNTLREQGFGQPDQISLISSTMIQIQTTETLDQLIELCIKVFQNMISNIDGSLKGDSSIVHVIQYYIQLHLNESLTLEQMATVFHFNASYFSTFFARATGEPFSKYVINLRLSKAAQLLNNSPFPIRTICEKTGFNSEKTFYKQFKNRFKCTPNAYREAHKIQPVLYDEIMYSSKQKRRNQNDN